MPVNTAKSHYLGKDGFARMNCAQAVGLSQEVIELFRAYGGGRAPDGLCGALYAAMYILKNKNAGEKSAELEKFFLEQAGALKCHEVRTCRKLSCLGCVEKSSEFIDKLAL